MIPNAKSRLLLNTYIRPFKSRIYLITFLAIICACFEAVNLGALVPLLQLLEGDENPGGTLWGILTSGFGLMGLELNFTNLLIVMALLFFIGQSLIFIKKRMQARLWFTFSADLKKTLFAETLRTDISYHHSRKAGDLIDLIARQSENGANIAYTLTEIFTYIFFILIYTLMLLYISVPMTVICLVIAGTCMYALNYYIRISKKMGTIAIEVNMQMNSFINERLNLLKLIKTCSTEDLEEERFARIRRAYADANSNFMINGIKIETIFQLIIFSLAILILYVATVLIQMPLPLLLVFVFILIRLTDPLRQINAQRHVLATQFASLEKVDEVLQSIRQHKTIADGKNLFVGVQDAIEIRDVTYSYDKTSPVISSVSFSIRKNEMVALVGASGGGKSTIVDLLIRLIEPDKGEIMVDTTNTRNFSLQSYHRRIGFVSQDSYLFNDTILANICYGSGSVSGAEAEEAAKKAHAHEFILDLPEGYATMIGEKGVKLSGGQKQRLSLARALYKKPEILILDEATSALDSESERDIQESIANIKHQFTIIAIAHRISTIRNADKILVIEKGRVVESGTHDELITRAGTYANYYNIQYDQKSSSE